MASENGLLKDGELTASADCRTKQFCYAKVSGVGTVTFCAANSDKAVGVIQNKPNTNDPVELGTHGVTKIKVGAAVTAGDDLMPDTSGRAITATGSGASVYGRALDTATAADQIIRAIIPALTRVIP